MKRIKLNEKEDNKVNDVEISIKKTVVAQTKDLKIEKMVESKVNVRKVSPRKSEMKKDEPMKA